MINNETKIYDSQNKLYYICPFLEKIETIIIESMSENKVITNDCLFEIKRHFESIALIAKALREKDDHCNELHINEIFNPYNFSAVIKQIKLAIKLNQNLTEETVDNLIETYL